MKNIKHPAKTYRMSSGLNKFQEELYKHLIEYKWNVMGITEPGTYKGRQYDYMIPKSYAKDDSPSPVICEKLHPELRMLQKSEFKFKQHIMAYHMASSQCACINLFMPVLLDPNASEILKDVPGCPEGFMEIDRTRLYKGFCFEYWGQDIKNKPTKGLLNDHTPQAGTDADVAIAYIDTEGRPCIWLIEHKLAEKEFTCCGGYKSENNKHPEFCISNNLNSLLKDNSNCRYTAVGYNYWDLTARFQSIYKCLDNATQCPFLKGRNQLWRNQLLALALVETGSYAHAHFSVVHHRDNHSLNASMAEYRQMISPETPFSSFTNEDILRAAERHSEGLQEWIGWYERMYRM